MKTSIATAIAMIVALAGTINSASAQTESLVIDQPQTQVQPQLETRVIDPGFQPPVTPQANQFYFGMQLQLIRGYQGTSLRVAHVTYGSPAYRAGLEVGDEILTVNGRGFQFARDSFEAVNMMNQYVSVSAPAVAAAAPAYGNVQTYVAPPTSQAVAGMLVRNVRNGQNVFVNVYPQPRGFINPAPIGPAPALDSPICYTP